MNLKDKLIRKLLEIGKKHRILVYPTLALVAIVSAVSHAVYWGKGNGRKLVASAMVMVMLITQSLFLTSSADTSSNSTAGTASGTDAAYDTDAAIEYFDLYDNKDNEAVSGEENPDDTNNGEAVADNIVYDENGNIISQEFDLYSNSADGSGEENGKLDVYLYRVFENSADVKQLYVTAAPITVGADNTYDVGSIVNILTDHYIASAVYGSGSAVDGIDISDFYYDKACTKKFAADFPDGKIDADDIAVSTGTFALYCKVKRTNYKVAVSYPTTGTEFSSLILPDTYAVDENYKIVLDVDTAQNYGIGRYGWSYLGLKDGTNIIKPGEKITISPNPDGESDTATVVSYWEPMDGISLHADLIPDDMADKVKLAAGASEVIELESGNPNKFLYSGEVTLPTAADVAKLAESEAYMLTGWKLGDKTYNPGQRVEVSALCKNLDSITLDPNVEGQTLEAVWAYKDIALEGTGHVKVQKGEGVYDSAVVELEYGDIIEGTIRPVYTDNKDGSKFSCTLENEQQLRENYGIVFTSNGSDSGVIGYSIGGQVTNVTGETEVKAVLKVTDGNKPGYTTTHDIIFRFSPKKVYIDESTIKNATNDQAPSKQYDGTTAMSLKTEVGVVGAQKIGAFEKDNVTVTIDSNAVLKSADAGENMPLTVTALSLNCPGKEGKYILVDKETGMPADMGAYTFNIAEITRKSVSVSIELVDGEAGSILFGQQRPEFVVKLDPSKLADKDKEAYDNRTSDMAFAEEILGFSAWDTDWTRYGSTGEKTITAKFENKSNYSVDSNGVTAKFTVNRDSAEKDVNYSFDREPVNGFYPGLIIYPMPSGGYDKIRLVTDGQDVSDATGNVSALFSDSIDLSKDSDMTNGSIQFQMYDTQTGAVTSIQTLGNLNIDTTGPEYQSHTVTPGLPYLNEFKFGSYYHSQVIDGVETPNVNVTVYYSAENSECDLLHYRYVDENGNAIGDANRTVALIKDVSGAYYATITIGTGEGGQLIVYATDKTGNKSDELKLRLDPSANEAYDKDNQTGDNYYEWMVENTKATAEIVAKNKANETIAPAEGKWYNYVHFVAAARDDDSGINRLVWELTKPDGTPDIFEENIHDKIANATAYGKVTEYNFGVKFTDADVPVGPYYMTGKLYDNSGNMTQLNTVGPFYIDCNPPVIVDSTVDDPNSLMSGKLLKFVVTEGSDESRISKVILQKEVDGAYDEEGIRVFTPNEEQGCEFECSYNIEDNGSYKIVAFDNAGNRSEKIVSFSGISDEKPMAPTIEVDGTSGKNGWYVDREPYVTIKSTTITEVDKIAVSTYYTIKNKEKEKQEVFTALQKDFNLTEEGEINVDAWAVSATSESSEHANATIKVDLSKPVIDMKEATVDAEGRVTINFTASDAISGININTVKLNGETLIVKEDNGVVAGSFIAMVDGKYEITVEDMAGNVAALEFVPLSMNVNPITDITSSGAKINAQIYEGTYKLSNCYIAYRKAGTTNYETVPFNKRTHEYGVSLDYEFVGLQPATVYEYRVYAVTKTSKETKVIEGSFKTGDGKSTTSVYGTVRYANGVTEENRKEPIYVSLFEGNTYVAGKTMDSEGEYNFTNISDGTYRIVATNGKFTQTKSVSIADGSIVYPTDYVANRGVNFILSGLSTHMVLQDGAVKVTADGLDQVYDRSYTAVITEEDWYAVDNEGATIDVTLYADYLDVADVSSTTQSVFADKIGKNNEIVRYIELNVVKTVRDADGNCINNTPVNVTRLVKPVTVAFPLGDLSGQRVGVASMHGSGNNAEFINWAGDSEAVLTNNYIMITTSKFSIYALYKRNAAPKTYTVTWKDGDGNTMKIEKVVEGNSATPPSTIPRKTATDKYTYTFSKWDVDYSNVKGDMIVSAWFTAHEITKPDKPGDNTNPGDENQEPKPPEISTQAPHYSYLGSAQSPNTGDGAPIVMLAVFMILSAAGMFVVIKKQKKH